MITKNIIRYSKYYALFEESALDLKFIDCSSTGKALELLLKTSKTVSPEVNAPRPEIYPFNNVAKTIFNVTEIICELLSCRFIKQILPMLASYSPFPQLK